MNNKTEDGALGADFEYEDSDSAGIVRFNHHPMQGMIGSFNFMQRVHRNVMLGFDFTHLVQLSLFSLPIRDNSSATVVKYSLEIMPSMPLLFKEVPSITWGTSFPFARELPLYLIIRWRLRTDQLQLLAWSKGQTTSTSLPLSILRANLQLFWISRASFMVWSFVLKLTTSEITTLSATVCQLGSNND